MRRRSSGLRVVIGMALVACAGGDGASRELGSRTAPVSEVGTAMPAGPTTIGSTTSGTTPPTVPSSTGLRAGFQESRLFATRRQLSLEMQVEGPTDVAIATIRLSSPLFETIEAMPRQLTIQAGQAPVSIPLSYGAARCTEPGSEPSMVEVTVDGSVESLSLGQSAIEVLEKVSDEECAVRRVTEAVEITFGDDWEQAGERAVSGQLVLRARRPGATATLDELRGSVIFTILPEGDSPHGAIDGDAVEDIVEVLVTASRCDVHALIESARKYVFTAYLSVDGETAQPVDFKASGDALRALEALLAACIE